MELLDIFDDDNNKPAKKAPVPNVDGLPSPVAQAAEKAAEAHDAAVAAHATYKAEADRLAAEVKNKLAALAELRDTTADALKESLATLLTTMDENDVTKIPMQDRPDIVVKVTPGRRKSITKKWLVETYGNEEAKKIWDAVPTSDPKREVVVPNRYEDEPEPY